MRGVTYEEPVHRRLGRPAGNHVPFCRLQRGLAAPKHVHVLNGHQLQRPGVRAGQQQHAAAGRAAVHRPLHILARGDREIERARGWLQHPSAARDAHGADVRAGVVGCSGGMAGAGQHGGVTGPAHNTGRKGCHWQVGGIDKIY